MQAYSSIARFGVIGISLKKRRKQLLHFSLRLLARDARFEARDYARVLAVIANINCQSQRQQNINRQLELKAGRQYADDRVALTVHLRLFANHIRVAAKVTAPQAVADDDGERPFRAIFFRQESAPDAWVDSEHAEEIFGYLQPAHALGLCAAREVEAGVDA